MPSKLRAHPSLRFVRELRLEQAPAQLPPLPTTLEALEVSTRGDRTFSATTLTQGLARLRRLEVRAHGFERIDAQPCAEFPDAGYAFQAPGGGPKNEEVEEAVANRLEACGKYAELFTGKPWRFSHEGNVAAALTPGGEKALRGLLLSKNRVDLLAISQWLGRLLDEANDAGPDFSGELAQALDTLPPIPEVMMYLARRRHPAAETLIKQQLGSSASQARIFACRAVMAAPAPELVAMAEDLAENDSEAVWRDTPDGEHRVKTYPVREMCTLAVQAVASRRAAELKQRPKSGAKR